MNTASATPEGHDPANAPRPSAPNPQRTLSLWAGLGLVLLLPMVGASYVLSFLSEEAGRCLNYGEGCPTLPDGVLHAFFWSSVALGLTAAALPRTRWAPARYGAVIVQWCAQSVLCLLIVNRV